MTGPAEAPELPLELRQILARVDLTTRMLPRDMQQTVFEQVETAYRRGAATADQAPPADAPTSQRWCSFLGCLSSYDARAVETGAKTATGWRRWNTLNLLLCPDHSHLWASGFTGRPQHHPRLERANDGTLVTCLCGWIWDTAGLTAGKVAETYLVHLLLRVNTLADVAIGWGA